MHLFKDYYFFFPTIAWCNCYFIVCNFLLDLMDQVDPYIVGHPVKILSRNKIKNVFIVIKIK